MTTARKDLDRVTGGLFLMICFTLMWAGIAENSLRGKDDWFIGLVFAGVAGYFLVQYFQFNAFAKTLPAVKEPETPEEKRQGKWFAIVFAMEGIAILVTHTVLLNTGLLPYFIPAFALIVGLHFFPLGFLFKRSFDFFMGTWTSVIAGIGIFLTHQHQVAGFIIVAFVGSGCAIATSGQGFRMISERKRLIT